MSFGQNNRIVLLNDTERLFFDMVKRKQPTSTKFVYSLIQPILYSLCEVLHIVWFLRGKQYMEIGLVWLTDVTMYRGTVTAPQTQTLPDGNFFLSKKG